MIREFFTASLIVGDHNEVTAYCHTNGSGVSYITRTTPATTSALISALEMSWPRNHHIRPKKRKNLNIYSKTDANN